MKLQCPRIALVPPEDVTLTPMRSPLVIVPVLLESSNMTPAEVPALIVPLISVVSDVPVEPMSTTDIVVVTPPVCVPARVSCRYVAEQPRGNATKA
jgi:hypothetical protein